MAAILSPKDLRLFATQQELSDNTPSLSEKSHILLHRESRSHQTGNLLFDPILTNYWKWIWHLSSTFPPTKKNVSLISKANHSICTLDFCIFLLSSLATHSSTYCSLALFSAPKPQGSYKDHWGTATLLFSSHFLNSQNFNIVENVHHLEKFFPCVSQYHPFMFIFLLLCIFLQSLFLDLPLPSGFLILEFLKA